jgi:hypothetical protein
MPADTGKMIWLLVPMFTGAFVNVTQWGFMSEAVD